MRPGEIEPSILPNLNVLRQAHREASNAELGVKQVVGNLIDTIGEMSHKHEYAGLIHSIGFQPFFVWYSTLAQLMHIKNIAA